MMYSTILYIVVYIWALHSEHMPRYFLSICGECSSMTQPKNTYLDVAIFS